MLKPSPLKHKEKIPEANHSSLSPEEHAVKHGTTPEAVQEETIDEAIKPNFPLFDTTVEQNVVPGQNIPKGKDEVIKGFDRIMSKINNQTTEKEVVVKGEKEDKKLVFSADEKGTAAHQAIRKKEGLQWSDKHKTWLPSKNMDVSIGGPSQEEELATGVPLETSTGYSSEEIKAQKEQEELLNEKLKPTKRGCMDAKSMNYDPDATQDDGSCKYLRNDPEYKAAQEKKQQHTVQTKVLSDEVRKVFDDPKLKLKEILKYKKTLQNLKLSKMDGVEYLKDYFHKKFKGFGYFDGEKRKQFTALSNSEVDAAISDVFYERLEEEGNAGIAENVALESARIKAEGITSEEYQDDMRKGYIKTYPIGTNNRAIADLKEHFSHGDFDNPTKSITINGKEVPWIDQQGTLDLINKHRAEQGKGKGVLDLNSGELVIAKDDKEGLRLKKEQDKVDALFAKIKKAGNTDGLSEDELELLKTATETNYVDLDVEDRQAELADLPSDRLQDMFEESTLALGGLNSKLNKAGLYEFDNPDYEPGPNGGKKRVREEMTLKQAMSKVAKQGSWMGRGWGYMNIIPVESDSPYGL